VTDCVIKKFGLTIVQDVIKIEIIVVIKAMMEKLTDTCFRERMPRL